VARLGTIIFALVFFVPSFSFSFLSFVSKMIAPERMLMGSYPKIIPKYINAEGRIVGGTKKHPSLRLGMERAGFGARSRGLPNDPSGFPDVPVPLVYLEQHGIVNYKSWTFKIVDIYCDVTLRYSSLTSWYPEI
jgi:hypothetical protein